MGAWVNPRWFGHLRPRPPSRRGTAGPILPFVEAPASPVPTQVPTAPRWFSPWTAAAAAWTLLYVAWSALDADLGPTLERLLDDIATLPIRLGIAFVALRLARAPEAAPRARLAWRLMGWSVAISAAAFTLRVVGLPLPAPASVALAVPQASLLLASLWQLASLGRADSRATDWIDAAAIVLALFLLGTHYVAGGNPFDSLEFGARRWHFLIYLITDATAMLFCATAWFRRPEGLSRPALGLLAAGFGLITLADLVFDQQLQLAQWGSGGASDVMVAIGFLLLLAGVDRQLRFGQERGAAPTEDRLWRAGRDVVAPLAILVSTIPMLTLSWSGDPHGGHLVFHVTGVVALLVLVLLRQHLARARTWELARERAAADARFRSLVQRSSDAILQVSTEHVVQWASPSASELAGTIPSLLVGRRIIDLAHPEDRDRLTVFLANASQPFSRNAALRWRIGRQGNWHDVESVVSDLTADPDVGSFVLNTRNVTERVRLEQQLRQSQKLEAVGRLAGGIAHDFNNILAAIISHAQLVRGDLPPGDGRAADLMEIEQTAQRGAALTRRLLSFSRPEAGEPEVQSLTSVIRGMEPLLRRLLLGQVKLTLALGDDALWIRTAEGQVEQILMNLAINARDAMPDGGTVTVSARARTVRPGSGDLPGVLPGKWAELTVTDDGTGMDAETLSRLFEPFFTTKPSGLGTGLGLTTVRGIVRALGGHVLAESAMQRGTTMRVLLPLSQAPMATDEKPAVRVTPTERPRSVVLLVDDEHALRSAMERLLQRSGYAVVSAGSAVEALQLLDARDWHVDLVVTDMVMPGMGGREFVRTLQERRPLLPVLCMSGHMEWVESDDDAPDAPWRPERLIAKPFAFPDLLQRVRDALQAGAA